MRWQSSAYVERRLVAEYLSDRLLMVIMKLMGPVGEPWTTLAFMEEYDDSVLSNRVACCRLLRKQHVQLYGSSASPRVESVVVTEACRRVSNAFEKSSEMTWTYEWVVRRVVTVSNI